MGEAEAYLPIRVCLSGLPSQSHRTPLPPVVNLPVFSYSSPQLLLPVSLPICQPPSPSLPQVPCPSLLPLVWFLSLLHSIQKAYSFMMPGPRKRSTKNTGSYFQCLAPPQPNLHQPRVAMAEKTLLSPFSLGRCMLTADESLENAAVKLQQVST